jgi:4,5-DOPA dioxygenase extradiol
MSEFIKNDKSPGGRMPVLFIGHGSPMNAIEKNAYTQMLSSLAAKISKPKVILVVSAHWMTEGTWVLGMEGPKTIHDFYGFPKELFDIQYPAPGSTETAKIIKKTLTESKVDIDYDKWGLDHGTWSVLRHMYPNADVPVLQLSLDMSRSPEYHLEIGSQLSRLRDQGVLILGSGNLVHNLRQIDWNTYAKPFDWAQEYDSWLKTKIQARDFAALTKEYHKSQAGMLSVPTMDHFLPMHYILGASDKKDELRFEFEEIHNASISMRTFGFWSQ